MYRRGGGYAVKKSSGVALGKTGAKMWGHLIFVGDVHFTPRGSNFEEVSKG